MTRRVSYKLRAVHMLAAARCEDLSDRKLGEFVLREQIGEGGYDVVYRAEQPKLKRDVVVKVLRARPRGNEAVRERFLQEAQLASRFVHPYAAHIYAFGAEPDELLWIAMELVQGVTLDKWLENHGPMPLVQFVSFFECVAHVVQTAHERGIIHRDLKPSNVMVVELGGQLFSKLLDFGIAKVCGEIADPMSEPEDVPDPDKVETVRMRIVPDHEPRTKTGPRVERLTRSGSGMGSAPYMSPEQWSSAWTVGPPTDIYSLGVVTYEVLTGRRPLVSCRRSSIGSFGALWPRSPTSAIPT
ncbi:MAG: serine/threonine protein kinase [Deltaproteobacteria bacterium]|nr:MAG: serine/threonine protein kinase [Deltaproteobacteria bacterium]